MLKSLRLRIIVSNALIIIILILTLMFTIYRIESKKLIEPTEDHSKLVTKIYAEKIASTIAQHVSFIERVSDEERSVALERPFIYKVLDDLRSQDDALFVNCFFVEPSGQYYDPDGLVGSIEDREYFKELVRDQSDYVISDAVISKSMNEPIIIIIVPILNEEDTFIGAIAGSIKLSVLSGELVTVKYPGESYGWIVESKGTLIAHPYSDLQMQANVLTADSIGFDGLSAIGKEMLVKESGVGVYKDKRDDNKEGKEKIVTYHVIMNTPGWRLAITTHKEDISAPVFSLLTVILTI